VPTYQLQAPPSLEALQPQVVFGVQPGTYWTETYDGPDGTRLDALPGWQGLGADAERAKYVINNNQGFCTGGIASSITGSVMRPAGSASHRYYVQNVGTEEVRLFFAGVDEDNFGMAEFAPGYFRLWDVRDGVPLARGFYTANAPGVISGKKIAVGWNAATKQPTLYVDGAPIFTHPTQNNVDGIGFAGGGDLVGWGGCTYDVARVAESGTEAP
jgi:hypothetical protein